MPTVGLYDFDRVCGCRLAVPFGAEVEDASGGAFRVGVRLRFVPLGSTWKELMELVAEPCAACS